MLTGLWTRFFFQNDEEFNSPSSPPATVSLCLSLGISLLQLLNSCNS